MSALCALSASCFRVGSADEEICVERGSLPVSTRPWMSVILPSLTVTRTWTGPYCVSIALPVAVPETALDVLDPVVAGVAVVAVGAVVAVVAVVAVATGAADACGWKASTPAVPATVAARTMGDRRIGWDSVSEGEGLEADAALGHAGALQLAGELVRQGVRAAHVDLATAQVRDEVEQ